MPRQFTSSNGRNFYGFQPLTLRLSDLTNRPDLEHFQLAHHDRMHWILDRKAEMQERKCLGPGLRDKIERCITSLEDLFSQMNIHQVCSSYHTTWESVPELSILGLSDREQHWIPQAKALIERYQRWNDQLNDVTFDLLEAYQMMISPS